MPTQTNQPAAIYAHANKPKSKEEQEKLEELTSKTFAGSILLPIGIFMLLMLLYLVFGMFGMFGMGSDQANRLISLVKG